MFGFLGALNLQIIAMVAAVAISFGAGWATNGWRLNGQITREHLAQQQAIQKKETENQIHVDAIRRSKDEQIATINSKLFDAIDELRKRKSRPATLPANGQSGTGATLYSEDAIFLIREAARADIIRTALQACYLQYDQVTRMVQ